MVYLEEVQRLEARGYSKLIDALSDPKSQTTHERIE
jgi:hypothetical protein